MHFEIQDGAMMSLAVGVLGHREAAGEARGERHARGRLRRHRGFEVVAVQVQHDAPVARPAQLDLVALCDAQGVALGGELAADEREVEGSLGGARCGERQRERRGAGEPRAQPQRCCTSMIPTCTVPSTL